MERPQTVYEKLYQAQSLRFEQSPAGLAVEGTLKSGEYELAGNVSSQFISGLLFALPLLAGDSTLRLIPPVESRSYIEMTRAAQRRFGVESRWQDETTLLIPGGQKYRPCDYTVEGDYSQAAFPAVLGAVQGGVTSRDYPPTPCRATPRSSTSCAAVVQASAPPTQASCSRKHLSTVWTLTLPTAPTSAPC